jgi:hypothetical protein
MVLGEGKKGGVFLVGKSGQEYTRLKYLSGNIHVGCRSRCRVCLLLCGGGRLEEYVAISSHPVDVGADGTDGGVEGGEVGDSHSHMLAPSRLLDARQKVLALELSLLSFAEIVINPAPEICDTVECLEREFGTSYVEKFITFDVVVPTPVLKRAPPALTNWLSAS